MTAAIIAALVLPGSTAAAQQQSSPPEPGANCRTEQHRAFDFWLGSWVVTSPGGRRVGTNRLTSIASGCAMLESWVAANGTPGTSLNYYDPADGQWHQHWAGSDGIILDLSGGPEDGAMVLRGERTAPDGGTVIDRITWTPEPDGTVRQLWETSSDGGATWRTTFDGRYTRSEG